MFSNRHKFLPKVQNLRCTTHAERYNGGDDDDDNNNNNFYVSGLVLMQAVLAGLSRRVIIPSRGLYLHRTEQHGKTRTDICALSGIGVIIIHVFILTC
jgi:hypothetical protein